MSADKQNKMNHLSIMSQKKFQNSTSNLSTSKYDYGKDRDFSALQSDEEVKEVTLQLVMIRKAYDSVIYSNSQKRANIEVMKKQINKLKSTTFTCSEDNFTISSRMNALQNKLQTLKYKLEEEQQGNKTYECMLSRMKCDTIGAEVKSSNLHDNLGTCKGHLNDYLSKARRNKEENVQSQKIFKGLKEEIDIEARSSEDLIRRLEFTALTKKEAAVRRQQRSKKQAEIAEIAANENKNSEEIQLKQEITLHKLYYLYLKSKQDKIQKASEETEEAFISIRVATGTSDVQTITENFLRKEEVNSQLKASIADLEKNLNLLKKKNEKVSAELHDLILISKESVSPYLHEVADLELNIESEKKLLEIQFGESQGFQEVLEQIQRLGEKFCKALGLSCEAALLGQYSKIAEKVRESCGEIQKNKKVYADKLDQLDKTETLSLFKSLHPKKVTRPYYLSEKKIENSFSDEQQLITISED